MPSRLARGYVTVRYRDCWVKSVSELMRCEEIQKETTETLNGRNRLDDDDVDVSPKVSNYQAHEDDEEISMDEEEDNMTIAQKIRCRRKYSDADKAGEDASEPLGKRRRKF
ncbi:hypothetical protein YC2023_075603 [Brassica napus]